MNIVVQEDGFGCSVACVERCKKYPFGHYLLKTEKGWMNPWINRPYEPRSAGVNKRLPGKPVYAIQACKQPSDQV